MDIKAVERKWQSFWEKSKNIGYDPKSDKPKHYVLEMFSYPSGAKLHIGHWYNYGPTDSYARFKRMQGYNVFQPMGFDAFGLPAENYAIKTGVHPKDSTEKNIETMEGQLRAMGAMFDWSAEIKTCDESYYKWTQWMFLQLYKKGLAYRKEAPVNWCPSCQTVLANEQVVENCCERCGTPVVRKNLTQWFFKITEYADELLSGLDTLDWPEKTKAMQRNWIGRSTGCEIEFECETGDKIRVFTTRCDTVFGVTYVVLAPEHPLARKLATPEQMQAVEEYIDYAARASEIDRLSTTREKTGVFTGSYAVNPMNGKKVPVYLADYVLATYGTGAVMAVPAHDERDFAFATKYSLPIVKVIENPNGETVLPYTEDGIMINSLEFDGLMGEEAREAVAKHLSKLSKGGKKINYRLRDWLVSRQRYWGAPIPVVHCPVCGDVPVPEKDLPVRLPYDVEFRPDGKSPLAKNEKFMHTVCPKCGGEAMRDPDTLDTFVCSSWYYLRYADAHNDRAPFDRAAVDKLLPVDTYVGGAEHACMHLLYARFFTKALRDMGYLDFDEPFKRLIHQGVILGPDGNRMSKSHGNVVSPDEYVEQYGSDAFRLYLMFGFSCGKAGFKSQGIPRARGRSALRRRGEGAQLCPQLCHPESCARHGSVLLQYGGGAAHGACERYQQVRRPRKQERGAPQRYREGSCAPARALRPPHVRRAVGDHGREGLGVYRELPQGRRGGARARRDGVRRAGEQQDRLPRHDRERHDERGDRRESQGAARSHGAHGGKDGEKVHRRARETGQSDRRIRFVKLESAAAAMPRRRA